MEKTQSEIVREHYNIFASARDNWKRKNSFYYRELEKLYTFLIPKQRKIIELGSGTGDLLFKLNPQTGVGVDISEKMVSIAKKKYPSLTFFTGDAQNLQINEIFDYVVMSDLIGDLEDVQKSFDELTKISNEKTRIILTCYNFLWEPVMVFAEKLRLRMPQPAQSWLTKKDVENLLYLTNLEVIKKGDAILIPLEIPILSEFANRYLARLPLLKHLCLIQYFVVRKKPNLYSNNEYTTSIIIPARNEAGNIESAVLRTPKIGKETELIFVEGHSKDNTLNEIKKVIKKYKDKKDISLIEQKKSIGKADAVRKGFAKAKGEILIILDADLTVAPEDLTKFYHALRLRKGEYVHGSRLVYSMEKQAMRLLNILGNKFFSLAFTFLLDQPIKDTLCGTKALFKTDYMELTKGREYFGEFDPFGDFDLIFGAAKLNLKMLEIPIRYHARTYGKTNIQRFRHGWILLKMTAFAAKKIKFF